MRLNLGTKAGIVALHRERSGWRQDALHLAEQDVWVVAGRPGDAEALYAGAYGDNLYRSRDAGQTWHALGDGEALRYVRAIAFSPHAADTLLVGTEPANIYQSTDGGDTWRELGIRALPGAGSWCLPYSPRAGAVRTLAMHAGAPGLVYAGVEQGGVLRSVDGGDSWTVARDGVHPDVHTLAVHPDDPQVLFAATGGGVFRSRDGADSWELLIDDYTRAVAVNPILPEVVLAGPARRIGHEGRILASEDGGDTWTLTARGLEIPMLSMVESFCMHPELPNDVYVITSQGQLLHSPVHRIRWRLVAAGRPFIRSLDVVP